MSRQVSIRVATRPRAFEMITHEVERVVAKAGVHTGVCHVFIRHTSASVMITENADGAVRRDLERFMQRIAPDGSPDYEHDTEGPDDMPAHIRTVLSGSSVTVPIIDGRLGLGTWQGIYVWEHRSHRHTREIVITIVGE